MKGTITAAALFFLVTLTLASVAYPAAAFTGEVMPVTDYSDARGLVGTASNVFVGKVGDRLSYHAWGSYTELQYAVDVLANIKGNIGGTVVVLLSPGGNGLASGTTYLMAAIYDATGDRYVILAPEYGLTVITEDPMASNTALVTVAKRNTRVRELEDALSWNGAATPAGGVRAWPLLAFAALVVLGTALTTGYVVRIALKRHHV
jgi:hypothetical protein